MPSFRIVSRRSRRRRTQLLLLGTLAALLLAGCGTSTSVVGPESVPTRPNASLPASESGVVTQLLAAADDWMGTPYRFGGTTRSGVDCSAFVRAIYDAAFGVSLTRSTRTQVREGQSVPRHDLRAGDLVFFKTGRNQRHVGIYLGQNRLLHASSAQNRVLVDDFDQDYFQRTYWTARRFLDAPPAAETPVFADVPPRRAPAQPAPEPEPARPGPNRSGW